MRPTADRVREALFARLGDLAEARVLDLYAGTGALGIEALSRGAGAAVFVERARAPLGVLRTNLSQLGLEARARVLSLPVDSALRQLAAGGPFDLILMDPPYRLEGLEQVLAAIASQALLGSAGMLVLEAPRRHPPGDVAGLHCLDERRYGDTLIRRYGPAPGELGAGAEGGGEEA